MPSTRKQKAREKRSRQSDVMSDLENMNVMLGNYQENQSDVDLNENVEKDSRSNGTRTDMVRNCEDFRTLLTSEDRNRCEIPTEANRLISEEIACQMNRKMDELRRNLDTQITESINSAIHDSILPSIQNSLSGQNSGLGTNVDSRSSRLSRNTEGKKRQSAWGNTHCRVQSNSNNHPQSRDNSLSSLDCRDDRDTCISVQIANDPGVVSLEGAMIVDVSTSKNIIQNYLCSVGANQLQKIELFYARASEVYIFWSHLKLTFKLIDNYS